MWLGSFCFQKVQQHKILSPLAKVVADTLVNLHLEGFRSPSLIWIELIRVEILKFPIRRTRKEDECVILKFYTIRISDSEPWDPIFLSLPCTKALDPEGKEEAP